MLMDFIRELENWYDWSPVETRAPQSNEISCLLWDAETKPMPKRKTVRDVTGDWECPCRFS